MGKSKRQNLQNLLGMFVISKEEINARIQNARPLLWDNVTAELRHPEEVTAENILFIRRFLESRAKESESIKSLDLKQSDTFGYSVEFKYKGLSICIDQHKAVIKNSLHKACKDGLNIAPYEAEELSTLYNELETITRLPIRKAQIKYLEIGYNSTAARPTFADVEAMRKKIPKGCKLMLEMNDRGGLEYGLLEAITKKGRGRKLVVYDKAQEIRDKMKIDPPEEITRIEAKRTAKHLKELRRGKPFLTLEDLTDPEVIARGYNLLATEARVLDTEEGVITPADQKEALAKTLDSKNPDFRGLIIVLGTEELMRVIEAHKFPNRNQRKNKKQRCLNAIKELKAYISRPSQTREEEILKAGYLFRGYSPQA